MSSPASRMPRDRRTEVVLVGGGPAHVQVLRRQAMAPLLESRVTVIVDQPVTPYAAMVPGFVAGRYARAEVEIDVRPLAQRVGARFVVARATGIDPVGRKVLVEGRPPIPYDVASLDVGSIAAGAEVPGVREHALPTRPLSALLDGLVARLDAIGSIAVVGAGRGGVELAFCLDARMRREGREVAVTLIDPRLPFDERAGTSRRVLADLARRGIAFEQAAVVEVRAREVVLADGRTLPADVTVWAAGAAGPQWLAGSLPVDARGFVRVRDTLQVEGHDDLFAVGGAVREGPVLAGNLAALLDNRRLQTYRPRREAFALLDQGDGTALGTTWRWFGGRLRSWWKDRVDRAFVAQFQVLDPEGAPARPFARALPLSDDENMVCGGSAAKVGEGPLLRSLGRLGPAAPDPDIALGLDAADDVAAVKHRGGLVVQSVDAFESFVDDPFLVGRVGAVNAVNDLYAKGVEPRYALAVIGVGDHDLPHEETLYQVLAGARATFDPLGVRIVGGHTSLAMALSVGFVITGFSDRVPWPVAGARAGDAIVLTRPLGTGVLFHEDMLGRASGAWIEAAVGWMTRSHAVTAAVCRGFDVHAATDVSGFGLAGHLCEMLRKSGVSAVLDLDRLPLLPGVEGLLERGRRSSYHEQNREIAKVIRVEEAARGSRIEVLFDPQTAGGLLLAVPAVSVRSLVGALQAAGEPAVVIADVVAAGDALLTVTRKGG